MYISHVLAISSNDILPWHMHASENRPKGTSQTLENDMSFQEFPDKDALERKLQVTEELKALGMNDDAISGILSLTEIESVVHLEQLLGEDNEAVVEIKSLFALAESSGCSSYLEFDPSVVRGLAYYTGQIQGLFGH